MMNLQFKSINNHGGTVAVKRMYPVCMNKAVTDCVSLLVLVIIQPFLHSVGVSSTSHHQVNVHKLTNMEANHGGYIFQCHFQTYIKEQSDANSINFVVNGN